MVSIPPAINPEDADVCPECGHSGTVEEITARVDGALRNRALTLSAWAVIILLVAHIYFVYNGKILTVPDYIWALILAPWLGESTARCIALADRFINRGAEK